MSIPEQAPAPQAPTRQYVNFTFYKFDPAWRRLPEDERTRGKQEFLRAVEEYQGKRLVIALYDGWYSRRLRSDALAHQLRTRICSRK